VILVLTGPTGSGKSELAIKLAKKINGEIINADAFQVYQELNIATAKPTKAMMEEVPHHLYDFVSLKEGYDISRYQKDARNAISDVKSRGHIPLLVGGSGLYIRSALFDYDFSIDTTKVDLSIYQDYTNEALHQELEKYDPPEAKKISLNNRLRLLRALAIILSSGESKTSFLSKQKHEPIEETLFFALSLPRSVVYERIENRVNKMVQDGLFEESEALVKKYGEKAPAFRAIGISELLPYFRKECTKEEVINKIILDTRHYVKRQETFFRHQFPTHFVTSLEEIEVIFHEQHR